MYFSLSMILFYGHTRNTCSFVPSDKTSDDVTKPVDLRDLDDLSDLDEQTMSQKSVTQTADNVQFVTSFVLSLTARTSPRFRSISQ